MVDALTGALLLQELDNGRYPHFNMLRQAGVVREQCLSIFPSITHAALSSIVTGKYPADHGVVGSHWFNRLKEEKVVYFSGSFGMMLQMGVGNFFREFLLDLNNDYLQAPTIFQALERDGRKTASLNFPLYRGDVPHQVNMPLLLQWLHGLPASTTLMGPQILLLGDVLANAADLGLDYYYNHSPRSKQITLLEFQLQLARPHDLPVTFHVREAFDDLWPVLRNFPGIREVIHSFTANTTVLGQVLDHGLYEGLNGIMTFTKDQAQLDAAKAVLLDRLVLETDAPFLTPVPYRGKVCEPKHIAATAEFLSGLRKESIEDLSQATTANACALFRCV